MSTFNTPWFTSEHGFFDRLKISKDKHVVISGETEDFAQEVIDLWRTSGFITHYVAFRETFSDFIHRLHQTCEEISVGDSYALVAFGDAAAAILQAYTKPKSSRLVAIVAYYPSSIPEPTVTFPASVKVIIHLAGGEIDVKRHPEVLGISQQNAKAARKRIDSGIGYDGCLRLGFKTYSYEECDPGFAEHDPNLQDVAFSRSLTLVRQAFRIDEDIELIRDDITHAAALGNITDATKSMADNASLLNVSSLTGGVGTGAIEDYYKQMFHPLPPSFTAKLVSRTIGSDRIVDELLISFVHSQPMAWLLPGVPATGRKVEIVLVSIACIRGGLLVNEHTYWDQASLLLQVGLLDPEAVSEQWKKKGVQRLPIVGVEGARAVRRGSNKLVNQMLRSNC